MKQDQTPTLPPAGKYGFDCFSHKKPILFKSVWNDFGILTDPFFVYPPWTDVKYKILRVLAKFL